jgi:iron complex transport system ATP-binding protein
MREGKIVAMGSPQDVVTPNLIRDVYGLDCQVYSDPVSGTPVVSRR